MPRYQFHRLPEGGADTRPVEKLLYNDAAAIRRAIGDEFPDGCDLWQGVRYVGRFHRAAAPAMEASADPRAVPQPDGRRPAVAG